MIKINDICKSYKKKEVLKDISLNLDNKVYGLLGPNGSGKTTLLRIIAGILSSSKGIISYEKENFKDIKVGYLPQKYGVFKEMTLYEQMNYYAILKNIPISLRKDNIETLLSNVNLTDYHVKCGSLSGGMIRRLGIAQAYLGVPDIILLDEPSAGLDLEERLRFQTILNQTKNCCPTIVSTHIVEDVEDACDYIIVLNKGKIVFYGTAQEICGIANNHVFEVEEAVYNNLEVSHYVIKIFNEGNEKKYRIICDDKELESYSVTSQLEDGYMYLIKGPFHEI
ncbi:MAG: ATP-binding cassette domain-containing protein [Coprobacillus sp.]